MKATNYPAVIHKDPDSDFGIHFPDVPGVISAGSTYEEALDMGREALQAHIEILHEEREEIPAPSPLDAAVADGGVLALVSVHIPGKQKRYNVMLDEQLVAAIDNLAGNRSAFLNEAARHELERRS